MQTNTFQWISSYKWKVHFGWRVDAIEFCNPNVSRCRIQIYAMSHSNAQMNAIQGSKCPFIYASLSSSNSIETPSCCLPFSRPSTPSLWSFSRWTINGIATYRVCSFAISFLPPQTISQCECVNRVCCANVECVTFNGFCEIYEWIKQKPSLAHVLRSSLRQQELHDPSNSNNTPICSE